MVTHYNCFFIFWRFILSWVSTRLELYTFKTFASECSRFKIWTLVNLFFFTLNFWFHTSSCLWPLIHYVFCFFVAPFLLQLPVLVFEPYSLQSLILYGIRWVVIKERRSTIKLISLRKLNILTLRFTHVDCIKWLIWLNLCSPFRRFKFSLCCVWV